jgi:enoyl-CoA hydratase/carnithine racemase
MAQVGEGRTEPVVWELRDGVGIIALNRAGAHNAISNALYDAWEQALAWAAETREVKAVLVCGNGRSFSSGRDRADIGAPPGGLTMQEYTERSQKLRMKQVELGKPMLAAIHGHVLGAGAQLALGADFRMAGESLKFGVPESDFGLVVDTGASVMLTLLAGPSRAKWLMMSGERLTAEQALAWGIVEWVVPDAELFDRAFEAIRKLASRPALALSHSKSLVDEVWTGDLRLGLRRELLAQTLLMGSPEHEEIKSNLAKRAAAKA